MNYSKRIILRVWSLRQNVGPYNQDINIKPDSHTTHLGNTENFINIRNPIKLKREKLSTTH